ncbi:MAG: vWA domain-containing protein [Bacteroidota bacterium]
MPSKLIFHSSWLFVMACFIIAAAASVLLYYRNKKTNETPHGILLVLSISRFVSTFLIAVLLLSILLRRYKNETEKPIILFALDNSSSIVSGTDSASLRQTIPAAIKELENEIGEKYQLHFLQFGKEAKTSLERLNFTEKESDFDRLFTEIDNNYANQNIGAVVMLSDGIYNKGANPNNAISKIKFPIYTIGLGDTTQYKDLMIQKIEHNEVAYLGDNFLVEVVVASKKIKQQTAVINLLHQNKIIQTKTFLINSDPYLSTQSFTLSAEEKGIQQYSAKLSIVEGEKNTANNQQDFVIDMIDNKEKIALVSHAPHPDIAAVKESIESKSNYSLECFSEGHLNAAAKSYALIIIEGYQSNQVSLINECKASGTPFWLINPEATDNLPGIKLNVSPMRFNETESYVDDNFNLFGMTKELKTFIKEAPAIKTYFGRYTTLNATSSLIKQKIGQIETENPVLIFSEFNACKCACFMGDGLWKWKMRNFAEKGNHDLFNELIGKTVQYLSVKKDKSFFRLRIPNQLNENESLEIEAELYNQSYELVNDAEVHFKLLDQENHEYVYTLSKNKMAYGLNVGLLKPGEYRYQADVTYNKSLYTKQGKLMVKSVVLEKMNLVANHALLRELSLKSNGAFYYLNQIKALKENILKNENIKAITYSEIEENYLVDNKWLFFVIVIVLGLEWFLRKRYLII